MAETKTMVPMIRAFTSRFGVSDVTVMADAGMFSAANKQALREAGFHYILSTQLKALPYPILRWQRDTPSMAYSDGQIWSVADRSGLSPDDPPHTITYYQYSWDRARRTLRGIDEQVAKAAKAVAGKSAIKRNRYVQLHGGTRSVNHALAEENRALAGIKGYETSRVDWSGEQVIATYRQLLRVEKSFRMSKSDLRARPIFHHTRQSIHAHLAVVTAASAVAHRLETTSGLSIKRLIRTLKRYRTFTITINGHSLHATSPIPPQHQPPHPHDQATLRTRQT